MNLSSFTTRSIYTQNNNFSFEVDLNIYSVSGSLDFGFSGNSLMNFSATSGKLIDHTGNYFGTYQSNTPFSISGNVGPSSVDYYVNGYPYGFGIPRQTGTFNEFYINPQSTQGTMNLYILGDAGSFTTTPSITYNTGDYLLPITITNTSLPFNIFSGFYATNTTNFGLSGIPSGLFSGSQTCYFLQSGSVGLNVLTVALYTDFGTQSFTVNASGISTVANTFYINIAGPSGANTSDPSVYYASFANPTGNITIFPSLSYVSGSGNFYTSIIGTGNYSGVVTGFIVNSGYLIYPFLITGSGFGGASNLYGTGQFTYNAPTLQYATGNASGHYCILGSGNATVGAYNGPATGILTGIATGLIQSGSGTLSVNYYVESAPALAYTSNPTGYVNATGTISYGVPVANDFLYVNNPNSAIVCGFHYNDVTGLRDYLNANTGIYGATAAIVGGNLKLTTQTIGIPGNSGLLYVDSHNAGTMSTTNWGGGSEAGRGTLATPTSSFLGLVNQTITGSGLYSQSVAGGGTGLINIFDYAKTFTGTWDLQTGTSIYSLVSYQANGYVNVAHNQYSGGSLTTSANSLYLYVVYTNPYGGSDFAELTLTGVGLGTGISIIISGAQ